MMTSTRIDVTKQHIATDFREIPQKRRETTPKATLRLFEAFYGFGSPPLPPAHGGVCLCVYTPRKHVVYAGFMQGFYPTTGGRVLGFVKNTQGTFSKFKTLAIL